MNTAQQTIARYNGQWFYNAIHLDHYCAGIAKVAIHHNDKIKFIFHDDSCIVSESKIYSEQKITVDISRDIV